MTSAENTLFPSAVASVFDSWTVLQLAVNHGFGGAESREKAEWMITAVDQWFKENRDIEVYEMEDFLADVMNTEFDTIVDDGSLPQISTMICKIYRLCCDGKEAEVREMVHRLPKASLQNCSRLAGNEEEEEEEDQGAENSLQAGCSGLQCNGIDHAQNTSSQNTETPRKEDSENQESMETEEEEGWTTVHRGKRR